MMNDTTQPTPRQLFFALFLPFAAGYFISYLFRTVNAVIGPVLAQELSLPDNALGLLTSTYFLAFGLAQLPLGILLDRYGPRRVEASLLVIAALGVTLFGMADTLTGLAIGRALIGLGVAACLMAALKAFAQWLPADRLASMTGWVMASGGLGALVAAKPLDMALQFATWREIAIGLGGVTLLIAALIAWQVKDKPGSTAQVSLGEQLQGVKQIFSDPHFWRYAPMAFWFTGGFLAIQGLWASRWMMVAEQLQSHEVATRLTWMSIAMLAGFIFLGFFATTLVRRGVRLDRLYLQSMLAAIFCFVLMTLFPNGISQFGWPLLAACFSLSNLSYSLVAQAFPVSLAGRANTALNLLVFAGAFGLQWGIGLLVDALQGQGYDTLAAYRWVFLLLAGGQALSLGWLLLRRPHP